MDDAPKFVCFVDLDASTSALQNHCMQLVLDFVQAVHAQVSLCYLQWLFYSYSAYRSAAQQGECCLRHGVSLCQHSCSALTENLKSRQLAGLFGKVDITNTAVCSGCILNISFKVGNRSLKAVLGSTQA